MLTATFAAPLPQRATARSNTQHLDDHAGHLWRQPSSAAARARRPGRHRPVPPATERATTPAVTPTS